MTTSTVALKNSSSCCSKTPARLVCVWLPFFVFLESTYPNCLVETFGNLLLLYCKHDHFDFAADVLAENAHLTFNLLSQHMYDYLDATITRQTSVDEACRKFEAMGDALCDQLRKANKTVRADRGRNCVSAFNAAFADPRYACQGSQRRDEAGR